MTAEEFTKVAKEARDDWEYQRLSLNNTGLVEVVQSGNNMWSLLSMAMMIMEGEWGPFEEDE